MPATSSTYVQHALWNYPSHALRKQKTKLLTARGPGSTMCTASLRKSAEPAYWPRRAPALGQRCTRAGERSAGGQRAAESGLRGLPKLSKHDHLILKCPKTHEGAQLGLGPRYASSGDMGGSARSGAENRNQTIKCRRHKSNNQNPTNTTFPSHSFSESKQSKSRENPGKKKTLRTTKVVKIK